MDYELLVDERIDDGRSLLAGLVEDGFDVTVAFWAKTSEEGALDPLRRLDHPSHDERR